MYITNNKILLLLFAFASISFIGQTSKITGDIKDEANGLGIPFATIQVKGTEKGTTSDIDGKFTGFLDKFFGPVKWIDQPESFPCFSNFIKL